MSDPNSSPVSLAAGSYEYDTLKRGLDKAAKGSAKGYDEAVTAAVKDASTSVHDTPDPRGIPGYKFVDVEHPALGVTENVQVFDPKLAEKTETETSESRSEADLVTHQAETAADAVAVADHQPQE